MTDSDSMTSRDRAQLRARAHSLKPILQVGVDGVSERFLRSLEEAFGTRELLKVRVLEGAPLSAKDAAGEIGSGPPSGVRVVGVIGRIVTLYRPHPEHPEIHLT